MSEHCRPECCQCHEHHADRHFDRAGCSGTTGDRAAAVRREYLEGERAVLEERLRVIETRLHERER